MKTEKDAPCTACGTSNITCFFVADGWCCATCEANGGMSHEVTSPAEEVRRG